MQPRRAFAIAPFAFVLGFLAATSSARVVAQSRPSPPDDHWTCSALLRPDAERHFLASEDAHPPVPPVDGDDLLALVDRSPRFRLSAGYVPRDLVDVRTMRPSPASLCEPPDRQCLRREAAESLRDLMDAMHRDGEDAWLDSAFRSFNLQCGVFHMWAYQHGHGFCSATVASALPGHSQHQLGTAIDLFTHSWVSGGERFREGFGCSGGGRWLAARSWVFGFVLPYPLHPDYREPGSDCQPRAEDIGRIDPRTGYKYEPWHIRYIGRDAAARFHAAWLASGPGTANEITLEQWLRARDGIFDPIDPPVCDGCSCSACATFHDGRSSDPNGPCPRDTMALGTDGAPRAADNPPALLDTRIERTPTGIVVHAVVQVPENTITQPPIVNPTTGIHFGATADATRLAVVAGGAAHSYPPLVDAWRLAIGIDGVSASPWQVALVDTARDGAANGVNARIPATAGREEMQVPIDGVAAGTMLRLSLVRGADPIEIRTLRTP